MSQDEFVAVMKKWLCDQYGYVEGSFDEETPLMEGKFLDSVKLFSFFSETEKVLGKKIDVGAFVEFKDISVSGMYQSLCKE